MKNKLILIISITLILSGSFGLYWVKDSLKKTKGESVRSFDPLLSSESEMFKNLEKGTSNRISSLLRESKKKKPAIKNWILKNFDNEEPVVQEAMLLALGNYKDKESLDFLISKVNQYENEVHSFYALKGISTHEEVLRVLSLQTINLENRSDLFLIHYHFALFKTKSYFADKKKDLYWLVDKASSLSDSKELHLIVMGLSQHVPNFEKLHDLLKLVLYKSKSDALLNRSVIHLSVYDSGWLKIQTKNILKSGNETLLREFLSRSGAFCPLDIWNAFEYYAKEFNAERSIKMAARVNMEKARELGERVGFDPLKLAEILKIKTTTLCH